MNQILEKIKKLGSWLKITHSYLVKGGYLNHPKIYKNTSGDIDFFERPSHILENESLKRVMFLNMCYIEMLGNDLNHVRHFLEKVGDGISNEAATAAVNMFNAYEKFFISELGQMPVSKDKYFNTSLAYKLYKEKNIDYYEKITKSKVKTKIDFTKGC